MEGGQKNVISNQENAKQNNSKIPMNKYPSEKRLK